MKNILLYLILFLYVCYISYISYISYICYNTSYNKSSKNKENYIQPPISTPSKILYSDMNGDLGYGALIYPGTIMMWPSSTPPQGWAICDGKNGTPDLRSRFVLGITTGTGISGNRVSTQTNLGDIGGKKEVVLTNDNIKHSHPVSSTFDLSKLSVQNGGKHKHSLSVRDPFGTSGSYGGNYYDAPQTGYSTSSNGNHTHTLTLVTGKNQNETVTHTVSTIVGNSSPISNIPPYYALTFIMKL